MPSAQIIFLHGFLGGPEDWTPIIAQLPCEVRCDTLDLNASDPLVHAKTNLEKQTEPFFLVGYSMGGRIAWRISPYFYPLLRGLILVGAHPGLATKEEKKMRWESDQQWIALLEKGDMAAFLQRWYAQPLFETMRKKDELISKRNQRDPRILIDMMKSMCLAHQPKLEVFSPTLFLHGAEDLKYANIYSEMPCVEAIADAGHAAHSDNPRAVSDAIRRFVEKHS